MAESSTQAGLRLLFGSGVDLFAQMPATSDALKRLIPSFSLSMIRVDERYVPQSYYSEHFDDFSHELFSSSGHLFAAATDDPAGLANLLRHPKPFGTLIDGGPRFIKGATYQHLFKRNGIHHVLDVALRDDGGPLGILGIFRERAARPFTGADVAKVAGFYPWLVHALRAETRPSRFDEVDSAMLVATPSGRIEYATPLAREWLGDAVCNDERTLLLRKDQLPEAVRALCGRCAVLRKPRPGRGHELTPPTLTLRVAGGRVRLRAYPLEGLAGAERYGVKLALELDRKVRVLRALEDASVPPKLRELAVAYWEGVEPGGLPKLLNVRHSTVKSYRKELYSRLHVTSNRALLERLDDMARTVRLDLRRHHPRKT